MQKARFIKGALSLAAALVCGSAGAQAAGTGGAVMFTQAQPAVDPGMTAKSGGGGSNPSLTELIQAQKKLRDAEMRREWSASFAMQSDASEPSNLTRPITGSELGDNEPRVLSLTGANAHLVAEVLHYGRVYRVDSRKLPVRTPLWTAVEVSDAGVKLKPARAWKRDLHQRLAQENYVVSAPSPGEVDPVIPSYTFTPNVAGSAFPAAGVPVPSSVLSRSPSVGAAFGAGAGQQLSPAQGLAASLPPMR